MGLNIVLFEPQIPANTGNIARTCAATNTKLHLIKPLGFLTNDKALKRAGLDYWEHVHVFYYDCLSDFQNKMQKTQKLYYITKFAKRLYTEPDFTKHDEIFFMFGKETTGLPKHLLEEQPNSGLMLPMNTKHVRALNLSNTCAIVIYEALRKRGFSDLTSPK